jgi:hypothetical protein
MDERYQDIRECIKLTGRKFMEKALDLGKTTVTDLHNGVYGASERAWFFAADTIARAGGKRISISKIERILKGDLSHLQERDLTVDSSSRPPLPLEELPYFERIELFVRRCDEMGKQSGRPRKNTKNGVEIRRKSDELKGRRDENIAEFLHLGHKDKVRSAVKIFLKGREELMQAVNTREISVHCAEELLGFRPDVVKGLLKQGRKAVFVFLRDNKPSKTTSPIPPQLTTQEVPMT